MSEEKIDLKNFIPLNSDEDLLLSLTKFLTIPEEEFNLIAPAILDAFSRTVNTPSERLLLTQSLNASGVKAEDFLLDFEKLVAQVDSMDTISENRKDFIKQIVGLLVNAFVTTEGIAKRIIQLPIELCHPEAKMPQYAHEGDSGMDVFALDDYSIAPGETKLIPTGLKFAIPPGYEIQVRPKSGRALKTKLRVANTPGTVDSSYKDEVCVIMENVEPPIKKLHYDFNEDGTPKILAIDHGDTYYIGKGEKFAQLVLVEVSKAALFQINSVANLGEDRNGGFGSTGLK